MTAPAHSAAVMPSPGNLTSQGAGAAADAPDFYNDNDPGAAAWLRHLADAGLIPAGTIDNRSILDVAAGELRSFRRCHFFAGIGGWAEALRLADWPDTIPVWTGSPPCQPFSAAGKRGGQHDARHLAPHFSALVRAARPPVLFGEQVAGADVLGPFAGQAGTAPSGAPQWAWSDDLQERLEASGYAYGAADLCAAGAGAPHIRQRIFFGAVHRDALPWVAQRLADRPGDGWGQERSHGGGGGRGDRSEGRAAGHADGRDPRGVGNRDRNGTASTGRDGNCQKKAIVGSDRDTSRASTAARDASYVDRVDHGIGLGRDEGWRDIARHDGIVAGPAGATGGLGDGQRAGLEGYAGDGDGSRQPGRNGPRPSRPAAAAGAAGGVADGAGERLDRGGDTAGAGWGRGPQDDGPAHRGHNRPGPLHGFWRDADWLFCRDGRWRPVEPGTFPLADGIPGRVGLLRGYGNAIVPQVAAAFITAFAGTIIDMAATDWVAS